MQSRANTVVQFDLPFDGVRDRIRNAAKAGRVVYCGSGLAAMGQYDIPDVIVQRALTRCELRRRARRGAARGEWQCVVSFTAKGFSPGGSITVTIFEGRVFVEDIGWDNQS